MAGRKKNETDIVNVQEEDVKNEDKKTLEQVMEEKKEKLQEKPMSELEKRKLERQRQRELLRNISDDLQILVFCNAGHTELVYECPNTKQFYQMTYGDTEWMSYKELKTMKSLHRGMLDNYLLVPIDVDSNDYEVEDILKILGIENLYSEEMLFEDNIDYTLNNLDYDTFTKLLKETNKQYVGRIIDRAIELAIKGQFNDSNKRAYIEKITGKEDMFKDAIDSYLQFQ